MFNNSRLTNSETYSQNPYLLSIQNFSLILNSLKEKQEEKHKQILVEIKGGLDVQEDNVKE